MTKGNNTVVLERFQPLHLVLNTPKGRGVFAATSIPSGSIIDISPVLVLSPTENKTHIEHTSLYHYTYNWPISNNPTGDKQNHKKKSLAPPSQAMVLGLGSMFNHSKFDQNVGWKRDLERQVIVYTALRDIEQGEELCISYGENLTFRDVDAEERRTREREKEEMGEEEMLRIEIDEC